MTDASIAPPLGPKPTLVDRDVEILRQARDGTLRQRLDAEVDVRIGTMQQYGLLRTDLSLTSDGEEILARRDEPVTIDVTAEAARWLSQHLTGTHHELRGHDAELALAVRDAATMAVIRHERPGITSEHLMELTGGAW